MDGPVTLAASHRQPSRNRRRLLGRLAAAWVAWALAAPTAAWADPGPSIEHQPLTSVPANQAVTIEANIVSNTRFAVAEPIAYVHLAGAAKFTRFPMTLVPGTTDLFKATLPADLVTGDFDYYLEAFDQDDNGPSRQGDEKNPLHVKVLAGGASAPPKVSAKPSPSPSKVAEAPKPAPSPAPAARVELTPPPTAPASSPAGGLEASRAAAPEESHTAAYALLGGGGAALVGAGVLCLLSLNARSTYLADLTRDPSRLAGDKSTSNLEAGLAWGALALGLAGAAAGTYLLTSGGSSAPAAAP